MKIRCIDKPIKTRVVYRVFLLSLIFAISCNFSFSQIKLSLTPAKSNYIIGAEISINFNTSVPLNPGSWVGLYKAAASHATSNGYLGYKYINEVKSITNTFNAPNEPGEYEFRIFDSKPEKEVASIPFIVVGIDPREINLKITSSEITLGNSFDVKIETELELSQTAWVGIYKSTAETNTSKGYLSYRYLKEKKKNNLQMKAPMEIGNFELRLYNSDPGVLIKQEPFHIGELNLPGISFQLDKKSYEPDEDMEIVYVGHEDLTNHSWFGLYLADDDTREVKGYLDYRYLQPKTGGKLYFKTPSQKGEYEVRLFYSNTGPMLLEPLPFSVSSSLDKSYLENQIETKGKVILYGIYFDRDKAIVKPESFTLIEQISKLILSDSNLKIRIEGHTDGDGSEDYNQTLSENRAKAIYDLLISKYLVPSSQLETIGYGESRPIGDNETSEGKAKNRRVELLKL